MADAVEAKVVNGLLLHLECLSLLADTKVAYPNVNFKPDGKAYVRVQVVDNTPIAPHISGTLTVYRGIMLATVCWPANEGIVQARELAGAIRDHFAFNDDRSDRRIIAHDGIEISVGIDEAPRVAGDDQGKAYTEIPVVIPWTVYP